MFDFAPYFDHLDRSVEREWSRIIEESPFFRAIRGGLTDRRFIGLHLLEMYQITRHTPIHQALVIRDLGTPTSSTIQYTRYCLKHALEEVGHEQMAVHDLRSLGFVAEAEHFPPPLPETEALISYLYRLATTGNPLKRLGYTYWAESC